MNNRRMLLGFIVIVIFIIPFNLSNQTNLSRITRNANYKTNQLQTRSDQWILDLQANYFNPNWFFTNLNANDRLMIRQAMDYAMPRSAIISSILNGFGSLLATYEVPQVGVFYNPSVHTLPYNTPKAIQLLSQVFGYIYSASTDNPGTPFDETAPYFPLNLIVPNSNPLRVQWANLIAGILKSIGIGATLTEVSFGTEVDRAFPVDSSMLGWDYAHGGFDGIFIGWSGTTLPDDGSYFYGSAYIPNYNYQSVNSSVIDNIIQQENNPAISAQSRKNYFWELQQYVANQSLRYVLAQNIAPFIYSYGMQGFNQFFANSGTQPYQNLTLGTRTAMTVGVPAPFKDLIPNIIGDVYSEYVASNMWLGGLLRFSTIPGDSGQTSYNIYSNLAYDNYTIGKAIDGNGNVIASAPYGTFYNFTIKPGIRWADGTDVTAQDVAFTYHQEITPARNTIGYGSFAYYMNNASIYVYDKYHIGFSLINWADPFPFGLSLFTDNILPQSTYNVASWSASSMDTGVGLTAARYNSNGPYQLTSAPDKSTGSANLTVNSLFNSNPFIFLDSYGTFNPTTGMFDNAIAKPTLETYAQYVSHVPGFNVTPTMKSVAIKLETDPTTALADLKAGVINWADTNIGLTSIYSSIINQVRAGTISEVNVTGASYQELGLNQASPIWGYSPKNFTYQYTNPPPTTSTTSSNSFISSNPKPTGPSYSTSLSESASPNNINTSDWGIFGSGSFFVLLGIVAPFIVYSYRKKSIKK